LIVESIDDEVHWKCSLLCLCRARRLPFFCHSVAVCVGIMYVR
jgi:hypothetical protein